MYKCDTCIHLDQSRVHEFFHLPWCPKRYTYVIGYTKCEMYEPNKCSVRFVK